MGHAANAVTSLAGIKLFKGGPYPDAGAGDKMQANQNAYMQQIAPIIASIASNAGIANPLVPGSTGQFTNDPYGLSPLDQASLNKQQGMDAASYDALMKKVDAELGARGLSLSSLSEADHAYLQQQLQTQLGSERVQAGQNAFQNRNQANMQIQQILSQAFGSQQQVTQQQGATAEKASSTAQSSLGNLLGFFLGGMGRGTTPTTPSMPNYNPPLVTPSSSSASTPVGQGIAPGVMPGFASAMGSTNWGNIFGM